VTWTLAAYQAIAAQSTTTAFISLITIDHAEMSSPLRLALNMENVTSNGNEYVATAMDVIPASSEPGEVPETQLRVDNANSEILDAIDGFNSPLDVTIAVVMSSDWDNEIMSQSLRMTKFTTDLQTMTATLEGPDFANEPVPALTMNRRNCPSLFAVITAEEY
jgi:hypothetical protein